MALYTVTEGEERPGLLALRLKVADRRITEVESVSREELIAITDRYLETLEKQLIDHVPFT